MPAHLIWKDGNGKHGWYLADGYAVQSLKTKSKAHADALLKQYNQGKLKLGPCPTVREHYEHWIAQQVPPLVRRSRIRDHKQAFTRHILPRFGEVQLKGIKTKELRAWQVELLKSGKVRRVKGELKIAGLNVKTVRNILDSSFRAMFKHARSELEVLESRDPFADLDWPKAKRLPPDSLSREEKRRVLDCFDKSAPWYYPVVKFQFDTGCRPSETIALTWSDLNAETRRVSINKSRYLNADNEHPKTTRSGRSITISRELMDLIQELRHPWSQPTDKVFQNKFGGPIIPDHFRKDYWDRTLKTLGIRKRKFYATRHTFITHCVEAGYKLKEIADSCGTSVQMIEENYCSLQELDPDRYQPTREILERYSEKTLEKVASPTGFEPKKRKGKGDGEE